MHNIKYIHKYMPEAALPNFDQTNIFPLPIIVKNVTHVFILEFSLSVYSISL